MPFDSNPNALQKSLLKNNSDTSKKRSRSTKGFNNDQPAKKTKFQENLPSDQNFSDNESHIELDNDLDISTTSSHSVETVLEIKKLDGKQTQQTITPNLFNSDNIQPIMADTFQEESTRSAHTSAGKTVVAEYAIAQALKNKQRVIYTTPIKALSNQKYRELENSFGDVGLITGDVTIKPDASCLVMTTEYGIFMIADEKGNFHQENFKKVIVMLDVGANTNAEYIDYKGKKKSSLPQTIKGLSNVCKIVNMIMLKKYDPVIFFTFSRKEYEEKDLTQQVFDNALNLIPEDEQNIPQIEHMLPFLRCSVAIHHSGLLLFLKEVVELLFQEGLIKVLFATETFSMGLNMPAKTVILKTGRRGLDTRGIVIIIAREKLEPSVVKGMMMGEPDNIYSAFHLKYNMILNMTRVEGISPDYILQRKLQRLEKEHKEIDIPEEEEIKEYYNIRSLLDTYTHEIRKIINHPLNILKYMIKHANADFGWVPLMKQKKELKSVEDKSDLNQVVIENLIENSNHQELFLPPDHYFVDVMLNCESDESHVAKPADDKIITAKPYSGNGLGEMMDLTHDDCKKTVYNSIMDIKEKFAEGIPLLDPIEHMGIEEENFQRLIKKIEVLETKLVTNKLHNTEKLPKLYELRCKKNELKLKIKSLKKTINIAESILQLDDLRCWDELVLTEILLNGFVKEEFSTVYSKLQEVAQNVVAGKPFTQIIKMGDSIFEGEIVCTFHYLDDLLRGMIAASKSIGNNELEEKFKEAIEKQGMRVLPSPLVATRAFSSIHSCQAKSMKQLEERISLLSEIYSLLTKFKIRSQEWRKLTGSGKVWENCGFFYFPCLTGFRMKHIKFLEEIDAFKATVKISAVELLQELGKEENEDRKAEIIHKLSDELNKLDVEINRLRLCDGCQKKNILNPLYELLTKLNESNESIISNKLLDTLKIIEDCTSCTKRYNYYYLFYESLNELKKISEELDKEENEDRKAEIIHKLSDELNKLDVKINRLGLCYGCQKKNILNPLYELLTKLNESNESIISNKLLDTLKIIEDCTKELDKKENEDRKAEIFHRLSDELNKLDVEIIGITLCYGCQKKNILNPLYELLTKLNESNESIISNKLLDTLKIIEDCTSCSQIHNYYYLFYESLNELKKISEELDKEENEDRKTEIIHKLSDELNKLDVEINKTVVLLCDGCQEKKIFDSLNELLTKLNESNESINSNQLLDTLKVIENCTSCKKYIPRNKFDSFCKLLNKLKKISEELDKEENEDRKAEIIYQLGDELNKLDVEIIGIMLCYGCQKKNILNPLYELLTKLNESNELIISNKLLDILKIIEDCTSCSQRYNNYYLFYESLNELKKISEELDKEENEDRKAKIIHKLGNELNKLDVKTNRLRLCYGCQKKNILNPLYELLIKLNESNESIISNKLLDTLKIIENCTSCAQRYNYYYLFYESLNELKKISEELDKEENEDRKAEITHKLSDESNKLDVEINKTVLCDKNCTSCKKFVPRNKFDSFCKLLSKLKISEELGKEENEDRKAEIIYQLDDELNKLDVKINGILCDGCQKENIFDPLFELLTKLNESIASINSNKLLDTLKIIKDCTGCKECAQKNYFDLFYESLNKLKKDLEELDKEENEDREAEMIHKLNNELNELDVEINRIALCYGCQEKNIFNPLCKLLTKLNESNEPINSNKLLDTLKILKNCTGCKKYVQKNNSDLFYKSLNKLKKISEELDKEENEDRKAEIIHKLSDELNNIHYKIDERVLSETNRQKIINSEKYLLDTKNHKHHPESFYTSRPLDESIQEAELLNCSSTRSHQDSNLPNLLISKYIR
nr:15762_t:CDS:10 [Entrophospora candida]